MSRNGRANIDRQKSRWFACGAAEVSSNEFFDVNNVPPRDIWVDFLEGTSVSWVLLGDKGNASS